MWPARLLPRHGLRRSGFGVQVLCDFELLPQLMDTDMGAVWLQETHGSVTVVPPNSSSIRHFIADYFRCEHGGVSVSERDAYAWVWP